MPPAGAWRRVLTTLASLACAALLVSCTTTSGVGGKRKSKRKGDAAGAGAEPSGSPTPKAVAAGQGHSCVLRESGAVACWGANDRGQLGDGTAVDRSTPVTVQGLGDAVELALGEHHSCARKAGGAVVCWGANDKGQLGDGSTKGHERPSAVQNLPAVTAVVAAGSRTCALNQQAVLCWGEAGVGGKQSTRPIKVAGGSQNDPLVELELGPDHSCLRHQSGIARCWGKNRDGRLGDGSYETRPQPVQVASLGGAATDLALGARHSCALRADGEVLCWGDDAAGALGQGDPEDEAEARPGPRHVTRLDDAIALASGDGFSCAVRETGEVACWGRNQDGQLGDGSREASRPEPGPITGVSDAVAIAAGLDQACAVRKSGAVLCWGVNDKGQLGRPAGEPLRRPTPVPKVDDATAVTIGAEHGCALRQSGEVYCWGSDAEGQLGDGAGDRGGRVAQLSDAVELSAGRAHTCARRRSGAVVCWGANNQGQIGNSASAAALKTPVQYPTAVTKLSDAAEVTVGPEHGCARKRDGKAVCWGRNDLGQLGSGTQSGVWTSRVPVRDLAGLSSLDVGPSHACGASGRRVACWGDNSSGQGGYAGDASRTPRPGVANLDVAELALGRDHSCARLRSGEVACWGSNTHGQLGDGGRMVSARALEVKGL